MNTKSVKWTTERGTEIEAILHYESKYLPSSPIDGGWGGRQPESFMATKYIDLYVNGTLKGRGELGKIHAHVDISGYDAKMRANGATIRASVKTPDGDDVFFGLSGIEFAVIETAWADLIAETDTDEVKHVKENRDTEDKALDIRDAEEILAHVESTKRRFKGRLPSVSEAKEWLRKYNDTVNEGGEGFAPTIVTPGDVKWAEETLAKNKSA